jgi:hypothetical protein
LKENSDPRLHQVPDNEDADGNSEQAKAAEK